MDENVVVSWHELPHVQKRHAEILSTAVPTTNTISDELSQQEIPSAVVVYMTSCPISAKTVSDTRRLLHILKVKGVVFTQVDLSDQPLKRQEMLQRSGYREVLPQLHVDGRYIGDADDVQEHEDFGELDALLQGEDPEVVHARTLERIKERLEKGLESEWMGERRPSLTPRPSAESLLDSV